ncbi:flagellar assembly protein A [Chrysiogenes arsenatis]|uniref:flagellar assembly protein A n=1 Tax=Chrysiogenes arsenatis TaxID=309797 RepID=UPI00041CAC29|nr:flagellar assembly protein A [Chrysiogenes arsenatis]
MSEPTSTMVMTENIAATLNDHAMNFNILPDDLDFTIYEESKPFQTSDGNYAKSWKISITPRPPKSAHRPIMDIRPSSEDPDLFELLVYRTSRFDASDPKLFDYITNEITKLLALRRIVFGIVPAKELRIITTNIMESFATGSIPEKFLAYPIAYGQKIVNGTDSKVSYHFDKYNAVGKETANGGIDYSKKNFTQYVEANKKLLTFHRPTLGQPGISPLGKIAKQYQGQEVEIFPFKTISPKLKLIDRGPTLELYSLKAGNFSIDAQKVADIRDDITVQGGINLGVTGDIYFDKDDRKDVNVSNEGVLTEAVGSGRTVQGEHIKIKGNVSSNATLHGRIVEVEGSIHRTAKLIGDDKVIITMGSGAVESPLVEAKSFQQGAITSDKVTIAGDVINAKIICRSFLGQGTMRNTELIVAGPIVEIAAMSGEENLIIVDPYQVPVTSKLLNKLDEEIKEMENKLIQLTREIKKVATEMQMDKPRVEAAVKSIRNSKAQGTPPLANAARQLQIFQQKKSIFERHNETYKDLSTQFKALKEKKEELLAGSRSTVIKIAKGAGKGSRVRFFGQDHPVMFHLDGSGSVTACPQKKIRISHG